MAMALQRKQKESTGPSQELPAQSELRCWSELLAKPFHFSESRFSPLSHEERTPQFPKVVLSKIRCALSTGNTWFSFTTKQHDHLYLVGSEQRLLAHLAKPALYPQPSHWTPLLPNWGPYHCLPSTLFQKGDLFLNQRFIDRSLQRSSETRGGSVLNLFQEWWQLSPGGGRAVCCSLTVGMSLGVAGTVLCQFVN